MKKKLKRMVPIFVFLIGILVVLIISYWIFRSPEKEAKKRNQYEEDLIDDYLDKESDSPQTEMPEPQPIDIEEDSQPISYFYSDIDNYSFRGYIDCILIIDKINLKKAIIRGNVIEDNDYNLAKYYFVTADMTTTLDGNYTIYGHSSRTYGHSFNRLDEMGIGDKFYIIQNERKYNYEVEAVDRALRSESGSYFPEMEKRVTFVSCEKNLSPGYSEKRVIIVRSKQISEEVMP